jgi:hypothetical protein
VDNYAYLADGNTGLRIIDITYPTEPTAAGNYDTPGFAWDVCVVDGYAYVADGASGLQIIDVSDPSNLTVVGSYDTPGSAEGVFVENGYIYVADVGSFMVLGFNTTGVEEGRPPVGSFSLSDNYPNPFNASTVIEYSLEKPTSVNIAIYDILGRTVQNLDQGRKAAGEHEIIWKAADLPSGVYFYRIEAGNHTEIHKMQLLK